MVRSHAALAALLLLAPLAACTPDGSATAPLQPPAPLDPTTQTAIVALALDARDRLAPALSADRQHALNEVFTQLLQAGANGRTPDVTAALDAADRLLAAASDDAEPDIAALALTTASIRSQLAAPSR